MIIVIIYCIIIMRGCIKGFNSAIYAIKCYEVVIELWLGSYSSTYIELWLINTIHLRT